MKKQFLLLSLLLIISACKTEDRFFNSGQAIIIQVKGSIIHCHDGVSAKLKELEDKDYNIFFLTRHAEKVQTGSDPELLPEGRERAIRLANILELVQLDLICSSPYKRTRATAEVCANNSNMNITDYNPNSYNQNAFFSEVISSQPGSRVLVVGHSNSIPELLNFFVEESVYSHIDHDDYDNFYLVAIKEGEAGKVWQFQY